MEAHAPVEATDHVILSVFMALRSHERKHIMSQGSLKKFLEASGRVVVQGNTLFPATW